MPLNVFLNISHCMIPDFDTDELYFSCLAAFVLIVQRALPLDISHLSPGAPKAEWRSPVCRLATLHESSCIFGVAWLKDASHDALLQPCLHMMTDKHTVLIKKRGMNNIATTSKTAADINAMGCEVKLSTDCSGMELLIHESP